MQHHVIDDLSYYSDHRTRARDAGHWYVSIDEKRKIAVVLDDDDFEKQVPFEWEVCATCNGAGSHVNPSIDCGGLTAEDFFEDPDFERDYMRGAYDEQCYECGGRRVVPVCQDAETNAMLDERAEFAAQCHAERMAEMRMGA